jgi:hypothetical protein
MLELLHSNAYSDDVGRLITPLLAHGLKDMSLPLVILGRSS